MPMLLEDLAEETAASQRRVAERLEEEIHRLEEEGRRLDEVPQHVRDLRNLGQRAVESAQQATDHVLSRVPQVEGVWRHALAALRENPLRGDAEGILASALAVLESVSDLLRPPVRLWRFARVLGAESDRLDELEKAQERVGGLIQEARRALEHRRSGWQPADPDRLARGLQLSREGQVVKADEARARFRRTTP